MRDPITIPVDDPSRTGEVRRAAVALAAALEMGEDERGRVALLATEAATNLVKHAVRGEVILRTLTAAEGAGIEVLALDRGPGMAEPGRCLRDGFSTTGTAGNGLGALRRLSSEFDLSSVPGQGTVLVARVRTGDPASASEYQVGAVCLPVASEEVCGDAWAVATVGGTTMVLVADGLGHGPSAAIAASEAGRLFRQATQSNRPDPVELMRALHAGLRPTRGAAAAVATIDRAAGVLRYVGVGNVAGVTLGGNGVRYGLVSLPGTLGHEVRKMQAFEHPWPARGLLVMHSDGLGSQWDLSRYPGLIGRHPAVTAGTLYRDLRRERDDVTVVAVRGTEEGS